MARVPTMTDKDLDKFYESAYDCFKKSREFADYLDTQGTILDDKAAKKWYKIMDAAGDLVTLLEKA